MRFLFGLFTAPEGQHSKGLCLSWCCQVTTFWPDGWEMIQDWWYCLFFWNPLLIDSIVDKFWGVTLFFCQAFYGKIAWHNFYRKSSSNVCPNHLVNSRSKRPQPQPSIKSKVLTQSTKRIILSSKKYSTFKKVNYWPSEWYLRFTLLNPPTWRAFIMSLINIFFAAKYIKSCPIVLILRFFNR